MPVKSKVTQLRTMPEGLGCPWTDSPLRKVSEKVAFGWSSLRIFVEKSTLNPQVIRVLTDGHHREDRHRHDHRSSRPWLKLSLG
jgi:hypothetical protein